MAGNNLMVKYFCPKETPRSSSRGESFSRGKSIVSHGDPVDPKVVEVDPAVALAEIEAVRKRKREYERKRHWKDSWSAKLPWAENVMRENGEISTVRCRICTKAEGVDSYHQPKIDTLWKHDGRKKAKKDMNLGKRKIQKGQWYYDGTTVHEKNLRFLMCQPKQDLRMQLANCHQKERSKKIIQFKIVFHLLKLGRPMTDYEEFKELCEALNVNISKKHWFDNAGWDMTEALSHKVLLKTREMLAICRYFSIIADEVTSVDNQQWISVHAYTVQNWKRFPIFLSLQRVTEGAIVDNLTQVLVDCMKEDGNLKDFEISQKLVCFGSDGAPAFQGNRTGVATQLPEKYSPYCTPVHCVAHRTNLAVEILDKLDVVISIEDLCMGLYSFFAHSPKRHLEFVRLAEVVGIEGLKLLRNVKQRWISLLEPLQRILREYKTLIVKMSLDSSTLAIARTNLDHMLLNFETMIVLPAILPLLNSVQSLIKFGQSNNVYICDFLTAVKYCTKEVYTMYVDSQTAFRDLEFPAFYEVIENCTHLITQQWMTDLNTHLEYLSFRIGEHTYSTWCKGTDGREQPVGRMEFAYVISFVKKQLKTAAEKLIAKLHACFPEEKIMNALGIVFPQFWLQRDCDQLFPIHYANLKKAFCESKSIKEKKSLRDPTVKSIPEPLNVDELDNSLGIFRMTMKNNYEQVMNEQEDLKPGMEVNPMTRLWQDLGNNPHLRIRISKWMKVAEIAIVTVIGSVEDERTFSNLNFIKNKLRNRLIVHLDPCVRMYSHEFWTLTEFPYSAAIDFWNGEKDRLGL